MQLQSDPTTDQQIRRALARGRTIDITTTGRRSGLPRRIEIVFHNFGGRIYISGSPRADRTRAWLLNLAADPHFTFHLRGSLTADLPATARIVTDEAERRAVFAEIVKVWRGQDIETMTRYSPLIEVTLERLAA
jgi:deazaflavin-dependent oxidoreductase (nitroreductase family)